MRGCIFTIAVNCILLRRCKYFTTECKYLHAISIITITRKCIIYPLEVSSVSLLFLSLVLLSHLPPPPNLPLPLYFSLLSSFPSFVGPPVMSIEAGGISGWWKYAHAPFGMETFGSVPHLQYSVYIHD